MIALPIRRFVTWPWEMPPDPPGPRPDPTLTSQLASLQRAFEAHTAAIAAETAQVRTDLIAEQVMRADHAHALAQAQTALTNQASQIATLHAEIDARKVVEQQLRGELREAYTRITALEQQLSEERTARTKQAEQNGYLQSQLDQADKRLVQQRQLIDEQGQTLARLQTQSEMDTQKIASLRMALDLSERDLRTAISERDAALAQLREATP